MVRKFVAAAAVVGLGVWATIAHRRPAADTPVAPELGGETAQQPEPPRVDLPVAPMPHKARVYAHPGDTTDGVVVEVSRDYLTIRERDGRLRQFERGPWLGSRKGIGGNYQFTNLLLGDGVRCGYDVIDGVNVAKELMITRRPGGTIPADPGMSPWETSPLHLKWQAIQDHEEKGTPLPPSLDPVEYEKWRARNEFIDNAIRQGWWKPEDEGVGVGVPDPPPPPAPKPKS